MQTLFLGTKFLTMAQDETDAYIKHVTELIGKVPIVYIVDKKVEIADTLEHLLENIEKSIKELKVSGYDFDFEGRHKEQCQSGWYQPMLIGKPKQHFKNHTTRARSKPVTICRYKWKLKKQKKNK